jgi:hypothetical protein
MDRTAWVVIALCILGLVVWEYYSFRQIQPRLATSATYSASASPGPTGSASPAASPSPPPLTAASPAPSATPQPSPSAIAFTERKETLQNSDLELHLTNRGGGIGQAVLLNHLAEGNQRVTINSDQHPPIGAILTDPKAPVLSE